MRTIREAFWGVLLAGAFSLVVLVALGPQP
ncbi:hypothetical protein Y590_25255 (plasmid) [Methylobacterium sp. AMS5]|nr:hypothetical protein Y590_25255 [Methylobacterium sp. AMS5]